MVHIGRLSEQSASHIRKVYITQGEPPAGPSANRRSSLAPTTSMTTMFIQKEINLQSLLNDTIQAASSQMEKTEKDKGVLQTKLWISEQKIGELLNARERAREEARNLKVWVRYLVFLVFLLVVICLCSIIVTYMFAYVTSRITGSTVWACYRRTCSECFKIVSLATRRWFRFA